MVETICSGRHVSNLYVRGFLCSRAVLYASNLYWSTWKSKRVLSTEYLLITDSEHIIIIIIIMTSVMTHHHDDVSDDVFSVVVW